jgi:predicted dehydrogenase
MNIVRVGVIGVGRMGQQHCRIYSGLRRAQLVGVHDTNLEGGVRIARRFEVPFYPLFEDLLSAVDAISIATPTPSHFEIAMKCLQAGVHVLVEKPMTETIEQAELLSKASGSSGLAVMVGHIERFNPAYVELKHVIEDMNVIAINLRRLSPYLGSNTDVDVVLDLMIHDIDLTLNLMVEDPVHINAYGISAFGESIDHAVAQLCFPSGQILTMSSSRVTEEKIRSIDVTAYEAYVEANLLSKTISIHRRTSGEYLNQSKRDVKYRQESLLESILVPIVEPLFAELQHFIDCILEKKEPMVTTMDGVRTLRLARTICDLICRNPILMKKREVSDAVEMAESGLG